MHRFRSTNHRRPTGAPARARSLRFEACEPRLALDGAAGWEVDGAPGLELVSLFTYPARISGNESGTAFAPLTDSLTDVRVDHDGAWVATNRAHLQFTAFDDALSHNAVVFRSFGTVGRASTANGVRSFLPIERLPRMPEATRAIGGAPGEIAAATGGIIPLEVFLDEPAGGLALPPAAPSGAPTEAFLYAAAGASLPVSPASLPAVRVPPLATLPAPEPPRDWAFEQAMADFAAEEIPSEPTRVGAESPGQAALESALQDAGPPSNREQVSGAQRLGNHRRSGSATAASNGEPVEAVAEAGGVNGIDASRLSTPEPQAAGVADPAYGGVLIGESISRRSGLAVVSLALLAVGRAGLRSRESPPAPMTSAPRR